MNPASNQEPSPPITLYTIGHSSVLAARIIQLLQANDIRVVVDVRSAPYSQYCPQFNRETFEQTLRQAGIGYRYAGEYLGGRPKDPTCYKDGKLPDDHADFLHRVDYPAVMTREFFQKGIHGLIKLAQRERVAVMCSEEDPAQCHRHHLIGRYLVKMGLAVLHIRGDGNLVKDQQLPDLPAEPPAEQLSLF